MTKRIALIFVAIILLAFLSFAQEPYKLPPKEIIDILDAPPTPRVSMGPAGNLMALIENEPMPSIAYVSQPILRVAGTRITPANNSRQVLTFSVGLSLKNIKTGEVRTIALPEGAKFTSVSWAPNGRAIAFLRYLETGVELWCLDAATGEAKALTPPVINAVTSAFEWLPDSRRLIVSLIPEGRGRQTDQNGHLPGSS
jgi:dipeptidyl aminopeptidase/acylaminoacyl peptidase